jgi:hypothetical protein
MTVYHSKPTQPLQVEAVQYTPASIAEVEALGVTVEEQPDFEAAGDAACVHVNGALVQPGDYVVVYSNGAVATYGEAQFTSLFDSSTAPAE